MSEADCGRRVSVCVSERQRDLVDEKGQSEGEACEDALEEEVQDLGEDVRERG
jgi:hypothetical protein